MSPVISTAVIPAAGRGLRAWPKTSKRPKALLEIDGKSLIERNIELLRGQMGVSRIVVIVGHLQEQIRQKLGSSVEYVECLTPDDGLARGLLLGRGPVGRSNFAVVLSDELYLGSNHSRLREEELEGCDAICGILRTPDLHRIKRNYGVTVENGRITSAVEKPQTLINDLLGCGTYLFTPAIFDSIEATPVSARSGRVELTDAIDRLARQGRAKSFFLTGDYFNINTVDDYNYASYHVREESFASKRISVVIPAYDEESSIASVVADFRGAVHEVLVVNNSSSDRTAQAAAAAGARVVTVQLEGYGDTIRHGLDVARGDILVVVEGDFSFRARDLRKMLEYLKDADMIVGTRTTRELVEQGANMRGPVRWGNVIVAKMVELLWWNLQPRFTDVGCTYRALWKETYWAIRPLLRGTGPALSPEMMVAALKARKRVIEVPVSYHRRIGGESKHSSNYFRISRTALRMLWTIFRQRLSAG